MKKILYILFAISLFTACSSSEDTIPTTEPETGDNMTTEQIIGTYHVVDLRVDGFNDLLPNLDIELIFKNDYILEELNLNTLERKQYTWSYSNKIISFENTDNGKVQGWFKNGNLKFKTYAKPYYPNLIGTFTYSKRKN